jgi:hypothetical protein
VLVCFLREGVCKGRLNTDVFGSTPGFTSTLRAHSLGSGADVYHGRGADLRHHHRVWDVLSRGVRILSPSSEPGLTKAGRSKGYSMVGRTWEGCIVRIKHISKQSGTEEFQWVWVWVGGFDAVDN